MGSPKSNRITQSHTAPVAPARPGVPSSPGTPSPPPQGPSLLSSAGAAPACKINTKGSSGARAGRVNRVTRGFAGLFSRQAPFNLLWKHLRTKAGTAAQQEPGFNVEELVPKRLTAAVGCRPSVSAGRNFSMGTGRQGGQPGPRGAQSHPPPLPPPPHVLQCCSSTGVSPRNGGFSWNCSHGGFNLPPLPMPLGSSDPAQARKYSRGEVKAEGERAWGPPSIYPYHSSALCPGG